MQEALDRVSTGVGGLDEVLDGGLVRNRTYMVRGQPGAGKSILGLEFLVAGVATGEDVMYVNMEEPEREIRQNAASLGIDVGDVEFLDLSPDSEFFTEDMSYDVFAPEEVEGGAVTDRITERVEASAPERIFVDPVTQLRHLSPDEYQFRKEVLSFMRFLKEQGATVLFTSQATPTTPDDDLQFMCDGVLELRRTETGRTVSVPKFRGSRTIEGDHALRICEGGITVFPRLVPRQHESAFEAETLPSGVPELDKLLHGGIERGTVTIITGSPGVGKTTTGIQFMKEAAGRGERSVVYSFEEAKNTLVHRCESINIPVETMMEKGTLAIEEVEALRLSATEFAHMVREDVETNGTDIVMIDGVEGYRQALRDENEELTRELHSVCRYLKNMGGNGHPDERDTDRRRRVPVDAGGPVVPLGLHHVHPAHRDELPDAQGHRRPEETDQRLRAQRQGVPYHRVRRRNRRPARRSDRHPDGEPHLRTRAGGRQRHPHAGTGAGEHARRLRGRPR